MTGRDVVRWALAEVGTTEYPPGSNRVKYWDMVLPEAQGGQWCGAFALAALKAGGMDVSWVTPWQFVYTPTGIAAARRAGLLRADRPMSGDVVWFNFDGEPGPEHVGIVVDGSAWPDSIETVEGNTSQAGSQTNGGAVLRKHRARSLVIGFATPKEDDVQLSDKVGLGTGTQQVLKQLTGQTITEMQVGDLLQRLLGNVLSTSTAVGHLQQSPVDVVALAAEIVRQLPVGTLTTEQVEVACVSAVQSVLRSV
jgi:hypothetical protein